MLLLFILFFPLILGAIILIAKTKNAFIHRHLSPVPCIQRLGSSRLTHPHLSGSIHLDQLHLIFSCDSLHLQGLHAIFKIAQNATVIPRALRKTPELLITITSRRELSLKMLRRCRPSCTQPWSPDLKKKTSWIMFAHVLSGARMLLEYQ